MFGEPQDQEGECNARLFIADNYGDGSATIRCRLTPNHEGLHREQFEREGGMVTITWVTDERRRCDHGCGQWEHAHDDDSLACPKDAHDHEYSDCSHCHPGAEARTCSACGKAYYYEVGHKRHCANQPFTCSTCGEKGIGAHACPMSPERSSDEDDLL
jgi:hypothetical protein